ncbi:MAG: hypothetical protein IJI24_00765, partial [Lachnospiraceae bacterium]|nr:hypothetical protein [Lachnospiraceae bacterium]
GQYMGGGSDLEAIMEISESIKDAQKQYILDHNADVLEPGDVQIVSNGSIYMDEFTPEDTQIINFADMIQTNYRLDEENHLLLIGEAEDVVLFTHQKDEEGNYPVVEAVFAEDGEAYTSSLEEMCVKAGISLDECLESITFAEAIAPIDLQHYMQEHPEITGIEYQGEIRTEVELGYIWLDAVMALYPEEGLTEGESEEAMTE